MNSLHKPKYNFTAQTKTQYELKHLITNCSHTYTQKIKYCTRLFALHALPEAQKFSITMPDRKMFYFTSVITIQQILEFYHGRQNI
jgi:hypothetical protein